MSLNNYSELSEGIAKWLNRDDLVALIPDFIALAESFFNDDLRLKSMIAEVTIVPSQVNTYVSLPDGFIEAIAFLDQNDEELIQVSHDRLKDVYNNQTNDIFYSVTSRINFRTVVTGPLNYTMTYYKELDLASDTTNEVLTKHPNIYLYGALIQAEMYLKNDKRVPMWHSVYEKAVKKANNRAVDSLAKLRSDHPSTSYNNRNLNPLRH